MYGAAQNGNDWMQIWGFIIQAGETDMNRNVVAIPSQKPSTIVPFANVGAPDPHTYVAEAEFYFDCDSNWSNSNCNGSDSFNGWDGGYVMYVPHWRVRMRRVHKPSIVTDLFNFGMQGILNMNNQTAISGAVQKALGPLVSKLGKLGPFVAKTVANSAVGEAGELINKGGSWVTTKIDGNGVVNTTIH